MCALILRRKTKLNLIHLVKQVWNSCASAILNSSYPSWDKQKRASTYDVWCLKYWRKKWRVLFQLCDFQSCVFFHFEAMCLIIQTGNSSSRKICREMETRSFNCCYLTLVNNKANVRKNIDACAFALRHIMFNLFQWKRDLFSHQQNIVLTQFFNYGHHVTGYNRKRNYS